jgi:hypothetical protein
LLYVAETVYLSRFLLLAVARSCCVLRAEWCQKWCQRMRQGYTNDASILWRSRAQSCENAPSTHPNRWATSGRSGRKRGPGWPALGLRKAHDGPGEEKHQPAGPAWIARPTPRSRP